MSFLKEKCIRIHRNQTIQTIVLRNYLILELENVSEDENAVLSQKRKSFSCHEHELFYKTVNMKSY